MKKNLEKYLGDYHKDLVKSLKDPKEAVVYINAALDDDDSESVFTALRNVVEAHGHTKTARMTGLNRVSLYKMLSKRGNPRYSSLSLLIKALGLRLRVEEIRKAA